MKALVPAFLLLAASAGLSQAAAPEVQGPDQASPIDPVAGQVEATRTPKRPPLPPVPFGTNKVPKRTPRLDGQMILHPPKGTFAQQAARPPHPQAHRLYPDLKLLPIREQAARSEPVSVPWPDGKTDATGAGRDAPNTGAWEKQRTPGAAHATQPEGRVR